MAKPRNLLDFNAAEMKFFLDSFDTIVTDCDGVLWIGNTAIEGSLETLKKLKTMGKRIFFVSNNSTMTLEEYCEKFQKMGYNGCADEIAIPSKVISWYLKNRGFVGKAFVLGTRTFCKVLEKEGIDIAEASADHLTESYEAIVEEYKKCPEVKAVIIDLDVNANWSKLGRAVRYLRDSDVLYIVGCKDRKIPISRNMMLLGNSQFVDLISKESNRQPTGCGKPSEVMKNYIIDEFGLDEPGRCLFIGDSLENDMKFADLCGFGKIWVGSGIDTLDSTTPTADSSEPDYYLPSLGLLLPLLETFSCSDSANCSQKPIFGDCNIVSVKIEVEEMTTMNVIISFLNKSSGTLRLSAGVSVFITLLYWFNIKRSTIKKDVKEDKLEGNNSVSMIENKVAKKNEVPDLACSEWIEVGRVKELYYYPLKSGSGKPINQCDFTDFGISFKEDGLVTLKDRMFLVYSGKTGKFQTGRNYAKLVLVSIYAVDERSVKLEANGMTSLTFRIPETVRKQSPDEVECSMWWGEPLKCIDCGSAPAAWISKFLTGNDDSDLRLGSAVSKRRNILKGPWEKFTKVYTTLRNEDSGYFADIASYMLMNETSLSELNKRLDRSVTFLQFRPNIVVSGCEPFAEDAWEWIKIGESIVLRNVKPCPRCAMVRIDPKTAEVDSLEPLKTLRSFREQTDPERVAVDGKAPTFGIYCGLYRTGSVGIDDRVFVRPFVNDM